MKYKLFYPIIVLGMALVAAIIFGKVYSKNMEILLIISSFMSTEGKNEGQKGCLWKELGPHNILVP